MHAIGLKPTGWTVNRRLFAANGALLQWRHGIPHHVLALRLAGSRRREDLTDRLLPC
jgi:hypothetical protein